MGNILRRKVRLSFKCEKKNLFKMVVLLRNMTSITFVENCILRIFEEKS